MLPNLEIIGVKKIPLTAKWDSAYGLVQFLGVLGIFFIQLFPNWTACNPITYTYTVAQNCQGSNKYYTAKTKVSRQYQIPHGKTEKLTAKQKAHGKTKTSRQNQKFTAKSKTHVKPKTSRQNQSKASLRLRLFCMMKYMHQYKQKR